MSFSWGAGGAFGPKEGLLRDGLVRVLSMWRLGRGVRIFASTDTCVALAQCREDHRADDHHDGTDHQDEKAEPEKAPFVATEASGGNGAGGRGIGRRVARGVSCHQTDRGQRPQRHERTTEEPQDPRELVVQRIARDRLLLTAHRAILTAGRGVLMTPQKRGVGGARLHSFDAREFLSAGSSRLVGPTRASGSTTCR